MRSAAPAMLKRLSIKGFRSIKDASVELGPLNVLIGANGAGKSNLVAVFKLLHEAAHGRLQTFLAATGRTQRNLHLGPKHTSELEIRALVGTLDYTMCLIPAAGDRFAFRQEMNIPAFGKAGMLPLLESGHLESALADINQSENSGNRIVAQHLRGYRVYHFQDTSFASRFRLLPYIGDNNILAADGGNLPSMLYAYRQATPDAYRRIVETVAAMLPDFEDFALEPDGANPNAIALNWRKRDADYVLGPDQFSDGSLRAIALVTLLLQPAANLPTLMVIDEPELGLHPYALEIVAGLIRAVSTKTQVVVATQSEAFLSRFRPEETIVAESNGNGTQFRRLDAKDLEHWLEEFSLGELWRRNVFGGGPLS